MKMETHKGTVLVEGKIIDIPIYSNRPGLSLQPVIDHRRLMVFTILKVLNGPLSHEPTRELAIDWPLPNNGPTPFVIEPPGNETKKLQLQYSLTISNGELIYKFTRTKKETPSQ
ncbi:MAG: hypothetical protein FKY71_17195 [Spiribacter salinus]|uniref:Uncharacterized protein n=1 Tax=Spiribacter salinus TaxID=1335746 RepID=A0A540VF13_9GAMM|nr:MAG: hypothetical protein FKY71_17195 [Spiribacter salinus]